MAIDASRFKALGDEIRRRRGQLELDFRQAAELAGISTTTWFNAEKGKTRPHTVTLGKVEKVLQWEPGTCDAILAGEPVTPDVPKKPKSDDTFDLATLAAMTIVWAQLAPGLDPEERATIRALVKRTQAR